MRYLLVKVLLTVSPFRYLLPPQLPCASTADRFFSRLFSCSYELRLPQLLYFDKHLRCPGCGMLALLTPLLCVPRSPRHGE
jgi:hypothetical protein